ncbi:hypothetical protein Avbf_04246 [Armadillidium vulgare]|nr:hypothetical protein Avbf_04246 [Armadillidium vulgare]
MIIQNSNKYSNILLINSKKGESGWPIIGYIPPSNITFRDVILKMGRKHGKIFTLKMGTRNFIFIGDFKALKEAFSATESTIKPFAFRFDVFTGFKKLGIPNSFTSKHDQKKIYI